MSDSQGYQHPGRKMSCPYNQSIEFGSGSFSGHGEKEHHLFNKELMEWDVI